MRENMCWTCVKNALDTALDTALDMTLDMALDMALDRALDTALDNYTYIRHGMRPVGVARHMLWPTTIMTNTLWLIHYYY